MQKKVIEIIGIILSIIIIVSGTIYIWYNTKENECHFIPEEEDPFYNYELEGWSEDEKIVPGGAEFDIVLDSKNNVHILFIHERDALTYESLHTPEDIYYMKLDNFGDILVNKKKIIDYSSEDFQFLNIAIDSKDNVHCSWGGLCFGKYSYTKLDNNGHILINDIYPFELIDSNDRFIAFSGGPDLFLNKLDNNKEFLIENKKITFASPNRSWDQGSIIDSEGNIHIIIGRCSKDEDFNDGMNLYYMKLDNNGNILINETQLTLNRTALFLSVKIAIDSQDNIHIIWDDIRDNVTRISSVGTPFLCPQGYYRKLDEYGNTLVYDKRLTFFNLTEEYGDGKYLELAIDSKDNIYIVFSKVIKHTWKKYYHWDNVICYQKLDNNGNNLTDVIRVSTETCSETWNLLPKIAIDSNDKIHIVWFSEAYLYYKTNSIKDELTENSRAKNESYSPVLEFWAIIITIVIIVVLIFVWWQRKKRKKSK